MLILPEHYFHMNLGKWILNNLQNFIKDNDIFENHTNKKVKKLQMYYIYVFAFLKLDVQNN